MYPQAPEEQVTRAFAASGQAVPHAPQFVGSRTVSAQTPDAVQDVVPLGQLVTQVPEAQCIPVVQTIPHAPQIALVFSAASQPSLGSWLQSP